MKGINIIGHINGKFGLGKALRLNIKALEKTSIPFIVYDYKKISDINLKELEYSFNFIQISLHEVNELVSSLSPDFFENKYNILYLVWESEIVPEKHHLTINLFDEIWTASSYCKAIFSKFFIGEITVVPHPVEISINDNFNENILDIYDEEKLSFLFVFDFNSSALRKNSYFLVDVFKKASVKVNHKIELILKTSNSHHHKKDYQKLIQVVGETENIKILDKHIDRNELNQLINKCDCYISLHHSEGFGLTLAEAMAHGKPVIGTNYSGNTEFMNDKNSFLVDTIIQSVESIDNHFDENTIWGNPIENSCIDKIIEVFSNKEIAIQKGNLAKQNIEDQLSYLNIGKIIEKRCNDISENMAHFNAFQRKINFIRNQYLKTLVEFNSNQIELKKIKNAQLRRVKKNILIRFIVILKNKTRKLKRKTLRN